MGKRFLIDTNILIYYFDDLIPVQTIPFVDRIFTRSFNISVISKIEFLGWHEYKNTQYQQAVQIIKNATIINLSEKIIIESIRIKRQKRIKTPDAVIAATCLIKDFTLVTRNTIDFNGIGNLKIYNPFALVEE